MHKVTATIICDSINESNTRLSTLQIHVPKFILQEINTHRVFSRSYNSARAIPARSMRFSAVFEPNAWLSNRSGMVGGVELEGFKLGVAIVTWRALSVIVKLGHRILEWCGLHKQHTNRWLEPIAWVDGVISGTDWLNFLKLRNHPDAQPEIRALANEIEQLLQDNPPDLLEAGEWHLPYIDDTDIENYPLETLCLMSAGRCARVSYGFKDIKNPEADLVRANRLLSSEPQHLSPFEHVAQCPGSRYRVKSGNFRNWVQFRQILESTKRAESK